MGKMSGEHYDPRSNRNSAEDAQDKPKKGALRGNSGIKKSTARVKLVTGGEWRERSVKYSGAPCTAEVGSRRIWEKSAP